MKDFLKRFVPVRMLYKLARIYWFFRRPSTHGAKIVLKNDGAILCVRHTYQPDTWTFPGGGMKRGENAEDTLRREVKEEVGIDLGNITYAGEFQATYDFKNDTVLVYCASVSNPFVICDRLEIAEAQWFPLDRIPKFPPNSRKIFEIAQQYL